MREPSEPKVLVTITCRVLWDLVGVGTAAVTGDGEK